MSVALQRSYGIQISNCQNTTIKNNFIQKAAPDPTSTLTNNLFGIFVDMICTNSIIQDNNVQRLGTGIHIQGTANNPIQLKCNYMSSNMSGLTLNNTNIGNQGTSTNPQDNQWATLPSVMTNGGAFYVSRAGNSPLHSFFSRSNSLPMFPPGQFMSPINLGINFANASSLTYNCAVACSGSGCPQAAMGMIVNKEGEYTALSEEEVKILDIEVYKVLKKNTDYYDPATNEGMEITTYLDSLENTNAGNIYRFEEKIEARDTIGAYNEMTDIIASTDIEQNFKLVNEIYWRTWFVGIYAFSPAETAVLFDIAYQDPSYGGTAVFTARVMLGIDVENSSTRRSSNSISSNTILEPNFVRFFPNPATDYVNYEITLEPNENASLEIIDLFGRIIFSKKIDYDNKTGFIDFKEKAAGFYSFKVNLKGKTETGKLVIE